MRTAAGCLLGLLGVTLAALGLLFLLGADGEVRRYVIAAIGLGLGAVAGGFGVALFRSAARFSPSGIRRELLALASTHDGELTMTDVEAAMGDRIAAAQQVLSGMAMGGECERRERDGAVAFVFPSLQPRVLLRRCEHCGYEAPLGSEEEGCPRCGASLDVRREAKAVEDGLYRMDE